MNDYLKQILDKLPKVEKSDFYFMLFSSVNKNHIDMEIRKIPDSTAKPFSDIFDFEKIEHVSSKNEAEKLVSKKTGRGIANTFISLDDGRLVCFFKGESKFDSPFFVIDDTDNVVFNEKWYDYFAVVKR